MKLYKSREREELIRIKEIVKLEEATPPSIAFLDQKEITSIVSESVPSEKSISSTIQSILTATQQIRETVPPVPMLVLVLLVLVLLLKFGQILGGVALDEHLPTAIIQNQEGPIDYVVTPEFEQSLLSKSPSPLKEMSPAIEIQTAPEKTIEIATSIEQSVVVPIVAALAKWPASLANPRVPVRAINPISEMAALAEREPPPPVRKVEQEVTCALPSRVPIKFPFSSPIQAQFSAAMVI